MTDGFGALTKQVMVDDETGSTKNFGFVSFDSFEASDRGIQSMNGQYLGGRPVSVTYAYKQGTKERHGSAEGACLWASGCVCL